MAKKNDVYDKFFRDDEGRQKAGEHLTREARELLDRFDPVLVETVRQRKAAGETLREIYHDLDENPDVLEIAMHLAVFNQGEDIRGRN